MAAEPPEPRAGNVVVRSLDGVTWVSRSGGAVTIQLPALDPRVSRALEAVAATRARPGHSLWQAETATDADYVILFGPAAAEIAQDLAARGHGHRVVICSGGRDAERVARILALPGDIVLQERDGLVLYPGSGAEADVET